MLGDDEIKEMHEQIQAMENELSERKKQLHQVKYQGLHTAMQAKKEAEEAVKLELKALGYNNTVPFTMPNMPLSWDWKF